MENVCLFVCFRKVDLSFFIYLSEFSKRYLKNFLATVSFEACSVLDHNFFSYDVFSTKST